MVADHVHLVGSLNRVEVLSGEIVTLCDGSSPVSSSAPVANASSSPTTTTSLPPPPHDDDDEKKNKKQGNLLLLQQKVLEFKKEVETMITLTIGHLSEEEAFWPAEVRKYGKKEHDKVLQKILSNGVKNGGEAFQMIAIAVFTAAGVPLGHIRPDSGWATPAIQKE
jgi:hypothetical protein